MSHILVFSLLILLSACTSGGKKSSSRSATTNSSTPSLSTVSTAKSTALPVFEVSNVVIGDKTELLMGGDSTCETGTAYGTSTVTAIPFRVTASSTVALTEIQKFRVKITKADGTVSCSEELSYTYPVLENTIQISSGEDYGGNGHTCALSDTGYVKCWGKFGGRSPTLMPGLTNVIALADGGTASHACALTAVGTIYCWGLNSSGQLGDGTTVTNNITPVLVNGITNATHVAVGWNHTCAILMGGSMQCWGGGRGSIGDGTPSGNHTAPTNVLNITTATQLSLGDENTCALLSTGTVKCWGLMGEVNGTGAQANTPVSIAGLSGVSSLSLGQGDGHVCAIVSGSVKCWGKNACGH